MGNRSAWCELPDLYSCEVDPDGATLLRNGEVVYRYGPAWSPECVAHDAWRHAVEIDREVYRLNNLLGRV